MSILILILLPGTDAMPPRPATGHLRLGPLRLEYHRYDGVAPDLPTLVLLHEGLGCVELWRDFPRRLAQSTGCPVLAYSRRGYGGSDGRPPPWPVTYMHEEGLEILPRVLQAAGIGRAILVGHSDGASIALIHAGGTPARQILGLVLMAPHVFAEELSLDSIRQARVAYEEGDLRQRLARYHGDNVDHAFPGWNGAWLDPAFRQWSLEPYLPEIDLPLLQIQGEEDQYGTRLQLETIAARVRGPVTTRLLPGCRHAPHLDRPQETLDAIAPFVARLTTGAVQTGPGATPPGTTTG